MSNLLAHFEPSELVEFLTFIGLFMHRLSKDIFDVVDQLVSPLHVRIMELLAAPVTGTDDKFTHSSTKKAYLTFLSSVMTNALSGVFISEGMLISVVGHIFWRMTIKSAIVGNKTRLEAILGYVLQVAEDLSDPASQRLAFAFLTKCADVWAREAKLDNLPVNGHAPPPETRDRVARLPGFEQFIYDRIVPAAFRVPSSPNFNIKDGQMLVVCHSLTINICVS